jgi:hypothetical protein
VSHEVMIAPEAPDRTSVMEDAGYEFPRIPPSKLFGKSEWVPNHGYESGQDGSKESRSADSWRQRSALETPSAIYQTFSPGTSVNKAKRRAETVGRLCENVRAQEAPPEEKGSADGAEPSQRSIPLLDLSGDGYPP